jgi:dolichol-phosphate mannosyltransferase
MSRVWVVLPTYEEADNVGWAVLAVLRAFAAVDGVELHILVVDDASPDGTGAIADALAAEHPEVSVLHRRAKDGIGPAYADGFRHALARGADYVCQLDADGSHDPGDLPRLLARVRAGADVAVGSRYVPGGRVAEWSRGRHLLSLAGARYARWWLGVPVRDATSGMKCFHAGALCRLDPGSVGARGFEFQIEMTHRALRRGLAVAEVPITFHARRAGRSKMSGGIALEALCQVPALRWSARGAGLAAAVCACVAVSLLLRAPWFAAPLGVDEGGLALVARGWLDDGDWLYGDYWLDRPPLLVALYWIASAAGHAGVRALGALVAVALIVLTALLSRALAGDRAARYTALLAALLGSSAAIQAVFTPAEAIGTVPSTLSVLALVMALRRRAELRWLALAGAAAVCALLIKQSFVDALLAGAVFLVVAACHRATTGFRAAWPLAYVAGAALPYLAAHVWQRAAELPDGSVAFALFGFRLDALETIQGSHRPLLDRVTELLLPALGSGLGFVLVWALLGGWRLRRQPVLVATLAAWLTGAVAGVLAGGSYWPHYLIQLAPVAAVAGGLALAVARPLASRSTVAIVALLALGGAAVGMSHDPERRYQADERAVAAYVRDRARPDDSLYVLYARANVQYYSGLRSPYPYAWSLMVRAIPGARARLVGLLQSHQRPTWLVKWHHHDAWGLDPRGDVAGLLRRRYREVARVCGRAVLLRRDVAAASRRGAPPRACPEAGPLGL